MAYFVLAEEVADAAAEADEERMLARRLYGLAGGARPRASRAQRVPCPRGHRRRTTRRASATDSPWPALLGGGGIAPLGSAPEARGRAARTYGDPAPPRRSRVTEAFSHYRRGKGSRAMTALRTPGARELLDSCDRFLYGGVHRFLEDCKLYRGKLRPGLSEEDRVRMLRLEIALLTGDERPWSSELLYAGGRPLVEVDPDQLEEAFRTDTSRPMYRGGRWVSEGSAP